MRGSTREVPKVMAAAERQMQAWAKTQEIADRKVRLEAGHQPELRVKENITISREAGACGSTVAELVGQKLGWEVLDRDLVDRVAAYYHVPRSALEAVDETKSSWTYDALWTWLDSGVVSHEKFVARMERVLLAAARRGHFVIVGRGAQFLLPRHEILAVRLIASEKFRVERLMECHNLNAAEARCLMDKLDQGRGKFVQHFFHRDAAGPHLYDVVINVDCFGPEGAAEQIVHAFMACGDKS